METQWVAHYELREILGEGGHGTVYKAWDSKLDSWVALKIFEAAPPEFRRTSTVLCSWKHPHIAGVYDGGITEGHFFLAMEYLPGGTLKTQIDALNSVGDRFPLEDVVDHALQVASGLAYAHQHGISHGNLKAENVMIAEAGVLKISDFNLRGEPFGAEAEQFDIYRLGILFSELATGQSLAPLHSDLPDSFRQVISRLVDTARPDRYQKVSDVISELETFKAQTLPSPWSAVISGPPSRLSPDEILADRFRIIRFLGKGGMGQVYAAEDLELGENVALKTVRPEIASDPGVMARFRQEIQLARKVTHPNVCRIYDLFHHSPKGSGNGERITFLTMELLQGETLTERLRSTGPMPTADALPLIVQMTAALDASHKAGIIHGDFKPSNVMLVQADDGGAPRVVVTDFGLARTSASDAALTATLRATGGITGTPAYMAPEQVEGGKTTPAVDIYAFGVVVYEIVTGKQPFTGESALSVALQRLKQDPPSPRTYVPDLDANWEKSILRCLERNPAHRFASIGEVPAALAGAIPAAAPQSTRRMFIGAALVLSLSILLGALYQSRLAPSREASSRQSVAVLGFTNLTGSPDAAWLSTALSEMFTTELAAGEQLRTIPGETIARMKVELSLADTGGFAPDTLVRIRNYLDADLVVLGSYVMLGGVEDKIRLDLRLQDASSGETLTTFTEAGNTSETLDLVSRAGVHLREKLGIRPLVASDIGGIRAALPSNADATRFYAQGLMKLRVFDALGARDLLEKAVAADPKHALARSALATSWSMLGFAQRAKDEAEVAVDLSQNLSREDKLLVEARYLETVLDWNRAAEAYETLFSFFPDNLDYGLRLASVQISGGNAKEAENTVKKLREFPAPEREHANIDLVQARAAAALSDFRTQQTLAAAAVAKGKSLGARLLIAGARLIEGNAFVNLGNLQAGRAAFEEARGLYIAAGDRWDAANAAANSGLILAQSGDLDGAKTTFEESLMIYRDVGDKRGTAAALVNLGTVLRSQGNFTEARLANERALEIYRETGDRSGEATSVTNLATLSAVQGDLPAARKLFQEALPIFREAGDLNAAATVLANLAELFAGRGDLAAAAANYDEALKIFRDVDNKISTAHTLYRTADLLLTKGDLAGARGKYEEALALKKQIGESGSEIQLALANLLLVEGRPGETEQAARSAAEQFRKEGRTGDEASALGVLARSLFAQGKLQELPQTIEQARRLSEKSGDRDVRLSVGIVAASIRGAQGDGASAIGELNRIVDESMRAGLAGIELHARLALGEVELAAGRRSEGIARLRALEDSARNRGYLHIAEKAAKSRSDR